MLAHLVVFIAASNTIYPLTYVSTTGSVVVALSESEKFALGEGMEPDLSNDGKYVVFRVSGTETDQYNLVLVTLASKSRKTVAEGNYRSPSFSLDGRFVLANQYDGNSWNPAIFSMTNISEKRRLLTDDGAFPRWNPDMKTITYTTLLGYSHLTVEGVENWSKPKLIAEDSVVSWNDEYVPHPLLIDTYLVSRFEVGPKGELVSRISILKANGVLSAIDSGGLEARNPTWIKDGSGILFEVTGRDGKSYLAQAHADGTGMKILFAGSSPEM